MRDTTHHINILGTHFVAGIASYTTVQIGVKLTNLLGSKGQFVDIIPGFVHREIWNLNDVHAGHNLHLARQSHLQVIQLRGNIDGSASTANPTPATAAPDEPKADEFKGLHDGETSRDIITLSIKIYRNQV